jgi:2-keto-3-deoxy-L-rhamnonate aldolase RhmA
MSALLDPAAVEMIALAGFDYAGVEMEHGSASLELLQNQARAAAAHGAGILVKLPGKDPHFILKVLECGIDAVMLASVGSAAGARDAVRACRYPPEGTRGASTIIRAAGYGSRQFDAAMFAARNRDLVVGVIVEETRTVEEIDEIVTIPGLDYVLVGVADLAVAMGVSGKAGDPVFTTAVERVISACNRAGIALGFPLQHPAYPLTASEMLEVPIRLVVAASDTVLLYRSIVATLERARPT